MIPLSILDLSPITAGGGGGYGRFWLAEHRGMPSNITRRNHFPFGISLP